MTDKQVKMAVIGAVFFFGWVIMLAFDVSYPITFGYSLLSIGIWVNCYYLFDISEKVLRSNIKTIVSDAVTNEQYCIMYRDNLIEGDHILYKNNHYEVINRFYSIEKKTYIVFVKLVKPDVDNNHNNVLKFHYN